MLRRSRILITALVVVLMMWAAAQAATDDLSPKDSGAAISSADIKHRTVPEPATMMLIGMGLLAAFRARRQQV